MFVFDLSVKETFDTVSIRFNFSLLKLENILDIFYRIESSKKIGNKRANLIYSPKKYVIGNKFEQSTTKTRPSRADILQLKKKYGVCDYFEVSALNNHNVADMYKKMIQELSIDPILKIDLEKREKKRNKKAKD